MEISNTDYEQLCESYTIFSQVGFKNFEPKIWLIFVALKSGGISIQTVSSKPCQSLMEHNITFDQIEWFLEELKDKKIFFRDSSNTYHLIPEVAYELHRVCYGMTKKIENSNKRFLVVVQECGYPINAENKKRVDRFTSGDDNAKSEVLKDLLSQLAYAGARLIIKCILRTEEKLD